MIKKHITTLFLVLVLLGCSNEEEKLTKQIQSLELNKQFQNSDSLVNIYLLFSSKYPEHPNSIKFMFKAAEIQVKKNNLLEGIKLYETIGTNYNDKELAPEALIRASVCFQSIPDPANAKRMLELYIKKFPTHERIEEVKQMNEIVGLSEEELIKRFTDKLINP
jgi:TolA-binding protein